jgi:cell fate regulator YaaT (PSP1 superfamily)
MKYCYTVHIAPGIEYDCAAEDTLHLKTKEEVIVRCERYEDCGTIVRCFDQEPVNDQRLQAELGEGEKGRRIQGQTVPAILRRTTLVDKGKLHENEVRSHAMRKTVGQKVQEHRLEMKVIGVHLVFDKSLLVVQFTAEGRVDFRELLRDLSRALHVRVELRQVGVRDEAAIQGGIGCCGRTFCCTSFLRNFQSINVKLAKEQGLSLNPTNISGACGRLKCCLRYESDGYRQMLQTLPRIGSLVESPEGAGKVVDLNPLTRRVRIQIPGGPGEDSRVADCTADDVVVKKAPGGRNAPPPPPENDDEE